MRTGNVEGSAVRFTLLFCFLHDLIGIRKLHAGVPEDGYKAVLGQHFFHELQQHHAVLASRKGHMENIQLLRRYLSALRCALCAFFSSRSQAVGSFFSWDLYA